MRDSMIFYSSFYKALSRLPDEERLQGYDAITSYALTGTMPEGISDIVAGYMDIIIPLIDASNANNDRM